MNCVILQLWIPVQAFHVSMEETAVVLAVTTHVGVPVALKVQLVNKVGRNFPLCLVQ